uniref:Uncharacterized protein n=1 Tax=Solanum lycopersicum TaxID=4081 RepID=A0A3Q7IN83_SOLLC
MAGPGNDENRNKAHEMLAMVNTCCYFYTKFGTKILEYISLHKTQLRLLHYPASFLRLQLPESTVYTENLATNSNALAPPELEEGLTKLGLHDGRPQIWNQVLEMPCIQMESKS